MQYPLEHALEERTIAIVYYQTPLTPLLIMGANKGRRDTLPSRINRVAVAAVIAKRALFGVVAGERQRQTAPVRRRAGELFRMLAPVFPVAMDG